MQLGLDPPELVLRQAHGRTFGLYLQDVHESEKHDRRSDSHRRGQSCKRSDQRCAFHFLTWYVAAISPIAPSAATLCIGGRIDSANTADAESASVN